MKIRLLGITFKPGAGISLEDFLQFQEAKVQQEESFAGFRRLYLARKYKGYHVALLLTVKDEKTMFELHEHRDSFTVAVRELEQGKSLIDFNYLVLNRQTGRGVYQYYWRSCALDQFGKIYRSHYRDLKKKRIDEELKAYPKQDVKTEMTVRKKYDGELEFSQMVDSQDIATLITEMDRIKRLEYTVTTFEPGQAEEFKPVLPFLRRKTEVISFSREAPLEKLARSITRYVGRVQPKKARVFVTDHEGEERPISLLQNYERFGEFEFEEEARKLSFHLPEFHNAPLIQKMVAAMKDRAELFEMPEDE